MLREGDSNSPIFPLNRKSSLRYTHGCAPRDKATANAEELPGSRPAFFFLFYGFAEFATYIMEGRT
nr:MAG TPA: hypothetical protein [Caudoviricetes sp.]